MLLKRPLGATGLDVSVLGLGTVKFGRNTGVKYPSAFDLPTDAAIAELIDIAEGEGINLIDTAPAYGTSEERVGRALEGRRDRWRICTKVGERFEDHVSTFDFSARAITASIEDSLRRLRTDRVEIVLIHSDGMVEGLPEFDDAFAALDAAKQSGKVRFIGASTKTVAGGLRAVERSDVVMVTLNRADRADEVVIEAARVRGVGVLIKKVFAGGHHPDSDVLVRTAGVPGVSSIVIGTLNPHNLRSNCRGLRAV
jgi:aryl-alcohol dehydrogenase-like predicted oxidoreductase